MNHPSRGGGLSSPPPAGSGPGPALSVVIPAYNDAAYLQACVASLCAGRTADMEIIVVDDGSADATAEVAAACAAAEPRVRVLRREHAGVSMARNVGLAAARGEYVAFVDADDEVEPDWAWQLLTAAAGRRPAIVKGEASLQLHDGSVARPLSTCSYIAAHTPLHWFGQMWSAIYRRDFLLQAGQGFFPGRIYTQDAEFQLRALVAALLRGAPPLLCPAAVYRYISRADSTDSMVLSAAKVDSALAMYRGLHGLLLRCHGRLPPEGVGFQYASWISNLMAIARRSEDPAGAAAAEALARQLHGECPRPSEMRQEVESRRADLAAPAPGSG